MTHVIIKIAKAELIRDVDVDKMDVYYVLNQGQKTYQGKVSPVLGKKPVWDESFDLKIEGDGQFRLILKDYDSWSSDDLLGEAVLDLNQLAKTGNNNSWFDIFYEGQKAGQVWIDVFLVALNTTPVLEIAVVGATLLRDTDLIGKMDPFVKLNINGNIFVSSVSKKGGKVPKWNESFLVPLVGNGIGLFSVWDLDGIKREIVGDAEFNLFNLEKQGKTIDIKLEHNGKAAGTIHLQVTRHGK